MLTDNGIKQEISYIYLHTLTTRLGYSLERTVIDNDSVDATICTRGNIPGSKGILLSPRIEVQLKATTKECSGDPITFPIPRKNYDELRTNTMVPRVLVVLFLPRDRICLDWDPEKISVYAKAYWTSLKGMDDTPNISNITIPLYERLADHTIQEWVIAAANREEIAYASGRR